MSFLSIVLSGQVDCNKMKTIALIYTTLLLVACLLLSCTPKEERTTPVYTPPSIDWSQIDIPRIAEEGDWVLGCSRLKMRQSIWSLTALLWVILEVTTRLWLDLTITVTLGVLYLV